MQPLALEAVENASRQMVKAAQQTVPVKTGRLRASIGIGSTTVTTRRATADVEARTHYAAFVEFGTVNMAPRAYMRTAARQITPGFKRAAAVVGTEALTRSLT
jgi:HK97 gp10 family phage protein